MQIERERAAVGRKQEAAMRPASYKSSLSLAMPVGTTRQKDKRELMTEQSDRKLHVVENTAVSSNKAAADQSERMNREIQ